MKRILLINAGSINSCNATGITLRSIFGELDKSALTEMFWTNNGDLGSIDINHIQLEYSRLSFGRFLSRFSKSSVNTAIKKSNYEEGKNNRTAEHLRQFFACLTDDSRIVVNKETKKQIKDYKPQVIYTLGASVNALKLSYNLSKELNIPIVIHYMDNWLFHLQWENNPFLFFYKSKLRKYARLCRERGNCGICISEGMAREYTKLLSKKHEFIMNSIDTRHFLCETIPYRNPIRFCYAGGLHLGRDKMLIEISKALNTVSDICKKNHEMIIYTGRDNIARYKDEFESTGIRLCEAVPHDRIKEVYSRADVLIHAEEAGGNLNEFTKYSVSTKISEYLSTGKPVLFFGPKDIYLYDLLNDNSLAFTAFDEESLRKALIKIMNRDSSVFEKTENALKFAKDNLDISVSIKKFEKIIDSAHL